MPNDFGHVSTPPSKNGIVKRVSERWRRNRRVRIALAGYAVIVVFGIAYGLAHLIGGSGSTTPSVIAAALVAAPLALAFIGDRITGVKVLSVEISLSDVSLVLNDDVASSMQQLADMGPSVMPQIADRIVRSIADPLAGVLLRINLGDGTDWWSTRIFLLAALADDYTPIRSLVFVEAGEPRRFVGLASPAAVRRAMGKRFASHETAYRRVRGQLAPDMPRGAADEVNSILQLWPSEFALSESDTKEFATGTAVSTWLHGALEIESVEWDGTWLAPLVRYQIIVRPGPHVALTLNGELKAVVDRIALATSTAEEALRAQLR